ncbi:MAG: hypothetical protein ACYDA6_00065 [Solirubrobacteraceae bacterium]
MPAPEDVTLGEVYRAVIDLKRTVDNLRVVNPDVYRAERAGLVAQLSANRELIETEVKAVRSDLVNLRTLLRASVFSGIGAVITLIGGGAFAVFHR